jgi:hypothetical protein
VIDQGAHDRLDPQGTGPGHRDPLDGLGRFHDLRQLMLFEVAR